MRTHYSQYIARKLYFSNQDNHQASRPAVKVALIGMIIGVLVMVVTICIVVGFKQTITEKIAGFGSHIQVVNFDRNNTYEYLPIRVTDSLLTGLEQLQGITHVSTFMTKPGIIKTDSDFQGIVYKGTAYWDYFQNNLVIGTLPREQGEVIISQDLSRKLKLQCGDKVLCYFIGENLRVRKLNIVGLYRTGLGEFDELFVLGLPAVVRQLNQWSEDQYSGIELMVDNFDHLDDCADRVYFATANRLDEEGSAYYTVTIKDQYIQVFAWLDLLNMNVVIIIILMLCVAGFNIISGLIILILDSIQLVGVLKALGANNSFVRKIFIRQATWLIGKGMLWGNVIGLVLAAIQYFTHFIPLDAATYYVNYVPIAFPIGWLIVLNIGTILVSLILLLLPSTIVTKISPANVMHFE